MEILHTKTADGSAAASLPVTSGSVFWNLPVPELIEAAVTRGEAVLSDTGALTARTGVFTGRSPKDKFIMRDEYTAGRVDWGAVNQPLTPAQFDALLERVTQKAADGDLFVCDGFAGSDPKFRVAIRIVSRYAWHSVFARQLFIPPTAAELEAFVPQFTIWDVPDFHAVPERDGTRTSTVIALNFTRGLGVIGGTEYAGEIKKSVFTVLNFLLPQQDVFPMHCSASAGGDGRSALFFGLSGTGKTTLSADPSRALIGDDEHGWSGTGVFNFEGGCYAKCVGLSRQKEPQIWDAVRFGTVLENVVLDAHRHADYDDTHLTENTRAAYPLRFIPGAVDGGRGGVPSVLVFLTADAFGVLPPVAVLTRPQTLYHFLSGYTSKLAGTERGVTAPEPNFSACFGAPFWPLPPVRYAQMLQAKLDAVPDVRCFLLNTGWTGGPYGTGRRMELSLTRRMAEAALSGELDAVETTTDPTFGLRVPVHIDGVPDALLVPRSTWADGNAYDRAAQALAARFAENFARFAPFVDEDVRAAGPRVPPQ